MCDAMNHLGVVTLMQARIPEPRTTFPSERDGGADQHTGGGTRYRSRHTAKGCLPRPQRRSCGRYPPLPRCLGFLELRETRLGSLQDPEQTPGGARCFEQLWRWLPPHSLLRGGCRVHAPCTHLLPLTM